MIWAIAALAGVCLGLILMHYVSLRQSHEEREALTRAMLQANNRPDAARLVAPTINKKEAEARIKAVKEEIRENGGVFSAANPFGAKKPEGI